MLMPHTIDPGQTIVEIVSAYPPAAQALRSLGIEPAGYVALQHESLRATCLVHQLDLADVVRELERAV